MVSAPGTIAVSSRSMHDSQSPARARAGRVSKDPFSWLVLAAGLHLSACMSATGEGADASIVDAHGSGGARDGVGHGESSSVSLDLPPIGNCQAFSNLGCATGQKCTALDQGDTTLALGCDSLGGLGEGAACTQVTVTSGGLRVQIDDDCGDGLACFSTQANTAPSCHRMCSGDPAVGCPDAEICSGVAPGLGTVAFCRPSTACQPISQTGCSTGQACYWSEGRPICADGGGLAVGEVCGSANDCLPGATCVAGTPDRCVAFCSVGDTAGCPAGSLCTPLGSDGEVGYCK